MEPIAADSSSTSASEHSLRRFVARVALFGALQLAGVLAAIFLYARAPGQINSYLAASLDKEKLLRQQTGPRVILVGGSNLAFGMDSETLERRIGRHPVNMGLQAGLGLPFMLNEAAPNLQSGDVVVLSLEYEHFSRTVLTFPNVYNLLEWNPGDASDFEDLAYLPPVLDTDLLEFGRILRSTPLSPEARLREPAATAGHYRRDAFDAFGDIAAPAKVATRVRVPPIPPMPELAIHSAVVHVNDFERRARDRGARVFFSYPPCPRSRCIPSRDVLERLHETLSRNLVPILLDQPLDLVLDDSLFLDTAYHLTEEGTRRRTEHFSNILAAALAHQ